MTEGDTLEEARRMAHDAIRAYGESLVADGLAVPDDVAVPRRNERLRVSLAT